MLHPLQSVFRHGHSTQSLLLYLTDLWYKSLDKGGYVGVVFLDIDISKVFDFIKHSLLHSKLKTQFNLSHSLCEFLHSYPEEHLQVVSVDGCTSDYVSITSGVPQDSILGPILFSMFINDLPTTVHSTVSTAYFADNSTFFVSADNIDSIESKLNIVSCVFTQQMDAS